MTLQDQVESVASAVAGKDRRSYVIRPIRASDAPSLMRGYAAMTEPSKWFRMLHAVPHLTETMALDFCTPDPARDLCLVLLGPPKTSMARSSAARGSPARRLAASRGPGPRPCEASA